VFMCASYEVLSSALLAVSLISLATADMTVEMLVTWVQLQFI
jgi:hypothetical protein